MSRSPSKGRGARDVFRDSAAAPVPRESLRDKYGDTTGAALRDSRGNGRDGGPCREEVYRIG